MTKHFNKFRKKYGKAFRKKCFPHYPLPKDLVAIQGHKFIITFTEGSNDESKLWKKIGQALADKANADLFEPEPKVSGFIVVSRNGEEAYLEATNEDGKVKYKLLENNIKTNLSHYEEKYLRRVNVENNSHSFYDLVPNSMGPYTFDIGARFGVIGSDDENGPQVLKKPFHPCLYWIRYYQNLNEGYTDETEYLESEEDILQTLFPKADVDITDDDASELYNKLMGYAKDALQEFNIDWLAGKAPYTKKQVDKCWDIWGKMYTLSTKLQEGKEDKTIEDYNNLVVDMIKIASPTFKKGVKVSSFTVKKSKDFDKTKESFEKNIEEWEERINAMEAVMAKPKTKAGKKVDVVSPFGNVEVRKASSIEMEHFKQLIAVHQPKMVDMVKNAWILVPQERKEIYDKALEEATNKEEKEFFHGSVNANMVSLISSGGPNVRVGAANGRMFGNGSYWANDFDKSLGYTSYSGSRWAKGNSSTAYMLVGKVHYGNPCIIKNYYDYSSKYEEDCKKGKYDCVHALRGAGIVRDEIITYDDAHSYVEAILEIA